MEKLIHFLSFLPFFDEFITICQCSARAPSWWESLRLNPIISDPIANTVVMRLYFYCLGSHSVVSNGRRRWWYEILLIQTTINSACVRSSNNFGDYFVIHFHSSYKILSRTKRAEECRGSAQRKERFRTTDKNAERRPRIIEGKSQSHISCVPEHFQAIPQIDFLCDKQ